MLVLEAAAVVEVGLVLHLLVEALVLAEVEVVLEAFLILAVVTALVTRTVAEAWAVHTAELLFSTPLQVVFLVVEGTAVTAVLLVYHLAVVGLEVAVCLLEQVVTAPLLAVVGVPLLLQVA